MSEYRDLIVSAKDMLYREANALQSFKQWMFWRVSERTYHYLNLGKFDYVFNGEQGTPILTADNTSNTEVRYLLGVALVVNSKMTEQMSLYIAAPMLGDDPLPLAHLVDGDVRSADQIDILEWLFR